MDTDISPANIITVDLAVVDNEVTIGNINTVSSSAIGTAFLGGPPGPVNSLSIGSVTTGDPGDLGSASITGEAPSQFLNLSLPTANQLVTSVASKTGAVTLVKGDVGLGNVDNTSDANKPVSTAQAAADALKVSKTGDTMTGALIAPSLQTNVGGDAKTAAKLGEANWGTDFGNPTVKSLYSAKEFRFLKNSDNSITAKVALDTGVFTASAFIGDGSGLTGVAASDASFTTKGKVYQTVFNVKDYGAVGDGTTNDGPAINSAITAAFAAGGGTVLLGALTYFTSTRIVPKSKVAIKGQGKGVTIIKGSVAFDYTVYASTAVSNVVLEDFTIDVNFVNNASAWRFNGATNCVVNRIEAKNSTSNGWLGHLGTADSLNDGIINVDNKIIDCDFDNHSGGLEMLIIYNARSTQVIRPRFINKTDGGPTFGLWQKCYDTKIIDASFRNLVGSGLYYSVTVENTQIINPYFENTGPGIIGANTSDNGNFGLTQAQNLAIVSPQFVGGANSVNASALQLGAVNNATITDPKVEGYQIALTVDDGNQANTVAATNWIVTNPIFRNNNTSNTFQLLHPAIFFNSVGGSLYGTIIDGKIYDSQATKTQRYPIVFNGALTWDNLKILNNRLSADTANGGTSIALNNGAILGSNVEIRGNLDYSGTNPAQVSSSAAPDATTSTKGIVQLAGDLGGTAAAPTVKNIQRVFNVKDYGAVADGSTSDSASINSAATAANAAGGGVVWFPAGNYAISTTIPTYNNVSFIGSSFGSVTLTKLTGTTGGNADVFRKVIGIASTYQDNVTIENFIIDASAMGADGNIMTLQGINGLTVRNIKLINPKEYGLNIGSDGGLEPYIERLLVENINYSCIGGTGYQDGIGGGGVRNGLYRNIYIYKENRAGTGIDVTNKENITYENITVEFATPQSGNWGLSSDFGAKDVVVRNCRVINAGQYGIFFETGSGVAPNGIIFDGCTVDTTRDFGIYVKGSNSTHATNVKVINNSVRNYAKVNPGQGIFLEYVDNYEVATNVVELPGTSGQRAIRLLNSNNGQVHHNVFGATVDLDVEKASSANVNISSNTFTHPTPTISTTAFYIKDTDVTIPLGTLDLNNHKVINVSTPTNPNDAANKTYVDTLNATNANLTGDVTSVGNATTYNSIVPIAKGGTGSASQNFVDLTTVQNIAGVKTLTASPVLTDVTTDATNKNGVLSAKPYTNANQPLSLIGGQTTSADNKVFIGGNFSGQNAATAIRFFLAANNNTNLGTEYVRFLTSGSYFGGASNPHSTVQIGGSFATAYTITSGNLTLTSAHAVVEIAGAHNITLPTVVGIAGRLYELINVHTSAITVTANGAQLIGNDALAANTFSIPAGATLSILANGVSAWRIV